MRIVSAHFYFSIVGEDGGFAMRLLRYVLGLVQEIRRSFRCAKTDTKQAGN
jgi:hypothetical protein